MKVAHFIYETLETDGNPFLFYISLVWESSLECFMSYCVKNILIQKGVPNMIHVKVTCKEEEVRQTHSNFIKIIFCLVDRWTFLNEIYSCIFYHCFLCGAYCMNFNYSNIWWTGSNIWWIWVNHMMDWGSSLDGWGPSYEGPLFKKSL